MFWIAWPEAPLIRLSITETTMSRPVLLSTVTPISQKFEPTTEERWETDRPADPDERLFPVEFPIENRCLLGGHIFFSFA